VALPCGPAEGGEVVRVDQGHLEALLGQELEEGEVVGPRGLQGHPGGAVVGEGGE